MKYRSGDFFIVPNRSLIKGKSPLVRSVYMALCDRADENGRCYPSTSSLAEDSGCGKTSVFESLKELEEMKLIERVARFDNEGDRTSNEYQLLLADGGLSVMRTTVVRNADSNYNHINDKELSEAEASRSREESEPQIVPIDDDGDEVVKYGGITDLKKKPAGPFSWKRELVSMQRSPIRVAKIVALYIKFRDEQYTSYETWYPMKARLLKQAKDLKGYKGSELTKGFEYCQREFGDKWSLEAVVKNMAKALKGGSVIGL